MPPTRRQFLASAAALAVLTGRPARPVLAAMPMGDRPLPELVPERDLPVVRVDVAASQAKQTLVLTGANQGPASPQGMIIEVPEGAKIPVRWWSFEARQNMGLVKGCRFILRGQPGKAPPELHAPADEGLVAATSYAGLPMSFELENLILRGGESGYAVSGVGLRFLRISGCVIDGGKDGLFVPSDPTVVLVEHSEIRHGGRADGLTHCVYVNYVEKFIAHRTLFHSARAEGHALKVYAANVNVRDCTIASWATPEDRAGGFHGMLPPLDVGAWANTVIMGNTIVRRGPTRPTTLEYRNRQWRRGANPYVTAGWGTKVVDPALVDNRDPDNPFLFRHLLVNNRFVNGILPDGSQDPAIASNHGTAVRNDGTCPWASEGDIEDQFRTRPADYGPSNERAVVWAMGNKFEGIPFAKTFDEAPYNNPKDPAPIRAVDALPAWAKVDS